MARTRWGRRRGEDGITTLETAVLFPLALLLILMIIQLALLHFADSAALAAARSGAGTGALYGSGPAQGAQGAQAFVHQHVGAALTGAEISTAGSSATVTRITVTGSAIRLIPFVSLGVSQSAEADDEQFVP